MSHKISKSKKRLKGSIKIIKIVRGKKDQLLGSLKEKVERARQDLERSKSVLSNLENQEESAKTLATERSTDRLENLQSQLDSTNILQRQKGNNLMKRCRLKKLDLKMKLKRLKEITTSKELISKAEIDQNKNRLEEAEKGLQGALNSGSGSSSSLDDEIRNIREKWQKRINDQEKIVSKLQQERQRIIDGQTGVDTRKRNELKAEIDGFQRDILTENGLRTSKLDRAKSQFDSEMQNLKDKLNLEVNSIQNEKDNIQPLEADIENLTSQINEIKSVIREEIHKNQVYRIAALFYKRSDVVDVTRKKSETLR